MPSSLPQHAAQRVDCGGEGLEAGVVEAHAVDHRAVLRQPEEARARVAGLRPGRHRPALDEPETGGQHRPRDLGVLVEPGREPDRIGQRQARKLRRQRRILGRRRPICLNRVTPMRPNVTESVGNALRGVP